MITRGDGKFQSENSGGYFREIACVQWERKGGGNVLRWYLRGGGQKEEVKSSVGR